MNKNHLVLVLDRNRPSLEKPTPRFVMIASPCYCSTHEHRQLIDILVTPEQKLKRKKSEKENRTARCIAEANANDVCTRATALTNNYRRHRPRQSARHICSHVGSRTPATCEAAPVRTRRLANVQNSEQRILDPSRTGRPNSLNRVSAYQSRCRFVVSRTVVV